MTNFTQCEYSCEFICHQAIVFKQTCMSYILQTQKSVIIYTIIYHYKLFYNDSMNMI